MSHLRRWIVVTTLVAGLATAGATPADAIPIFGKKPNAHARTQSRGAWQRTAWRALGWLVMAPATLAIISGCHTKAPRPAIRPPAHEVRAEHLALSTYYPTHTKCGEPTLPDAGWGGLVTEAASAHKVLRVLDAARLPADLKGQYGPNHTAQLFHRMGEFHTYAGVTFAPKSPAFARVALAIAAKHPDLPYRQDVARATIAWQLDPFGGQGVAHVPAAFLSIARDFGAEIWTDRHGQPSLFQGAGGTFLKMALPQTLANMGPGL